MTYRNFGDYLTPEKFKRTIYYSIPSLCPSVTLPNYKCYKTVAVLQRGDHTKWCDQDVVENRDGILRIER